MHCIFCNLIQKMMQSGKVHNKMHNAHTLNTETALIYPYQFVWSLQTDQQPSTIDWRSILQGYLYQFLNVVQTDRRSTAITDISLVRYI